MRNSFGEAQPSQAWYRKPRNDARSYAILTLSILLVSVTIPFLTFLILLCTAVFSPDFKPSEPPSTPPSLPMLLIGILTCGGSCLFLTCYRFWVSRQSHDPVKPRETYLDMDLQLKPSSRLTAPFPAPQSPSCEPRAKDLTPNAPVRSHRSRLRRSSISSDDSACAFRGAERRKPRYSF